MMEDVARLHGWQGGLIKLPTQHMHGLEVRMIIDASDQRFDEKVDALRDAIAHLARILPGVFAGMAPLPVCMGKGLGMAEAMWLPDQHDGEVMLRLGDGIFKANPARPHPGFPPELWIGRDGGRGIADHRYDAHRLSPVSPQRWLYMLRGTYARRKSHAKAVATIVHEFGHILHAAKSPSSFWDNRRIGAGSRLVPAALVRHVSSYAMDHNNFDEFVAEVFTGIAFGKRYPDDVMAAYKHHGGPRFPGM